MFENDIVGNFDCAGVRGTSTIPHRLRREMDLTLEEYAVMEFLSENKTSTEEDSWKYLGMRTREFLRIVIGLEVKEFIAIKRENHSIVTPLKVYLLEKWTDHFNIEEKFQVLYDIFDRKGNKTTIKERLPKVLKKIPFEELVIRAKTYMHNVSDREKKHKKGLDTYLSPDKKHWEDDESLPVKRTVVTQSTQPRWGKRT